MERTFVTQLLASFRRIFAGPETLLLGVLVVLVELTGPTSRDDVDDVLWVVLLPMLLMLGCSLARYRSLPLTVALIEVAITTFHRLRGRLAVSLGLDFHPEASPRLPVFTSLRRLASALLLASLVLLPAMGVGRELLALLRVRGFYSVYVVLLSLTWAWLLVGIVVQVPAVVLTVLELAKRRVQLAGAARVLVAAGGLLAVGVLLVSLDQALGLSGALALLGLGVLLPSWMPPAEPLRGPWLILSVGRGGEPQTATIAQMIRDSWRVLALHAFLLTLLLAPGPATAGLFPVTDLLLRVFAWLAAWVFTGGALLAVGEFNRRRRLHDPAFPRSRVLWAVPGPEATALQREAAFIKASGWRVVLSEALPGPDDADLLVGLPAGSAPSHPVPLSKVPPALFLLADRPGSVLTEAEERDKSARALVAIERMLASARPRGGDRGEGTFLVPHCWLVLGLTRDDERGGIERPPGHALGQGYRAALGTRLRRFLFEVMQRAGIDVFFVEDAVTPQHVRRVLELLLERHVRRELPPTVAEHDFTGIEGVRVVLQDVQPEAEGLPGVDAHVTRSAISRARILIIGRDRTDDDDDDGPPSEGEATDLWLKHALSNLLPRVQTA
ncbi:MAG: hypothetical protein DRQ55_10500 [Planctomycetota bacterium]|nr:MAG: hypothetical protein DRQ55_10500 [Planctomycetota bacterium]